MLHVLHDLPHPFYRPVPKVVGAVGIGGLVGLLRFVTRLTEIPISKAREKLVTDDIDDGGSAHVELTTIMVGKVGNCIGNNFWISNTRLPGTLERCLYISFDSWSP